jgi:exonuclease VII large subunit
MDQRNNPAGALGLVDKLREGATAQLSTQKDRATEGIGSVVQAVRQSTQHLRETQHETIAEYVDEAASQLERFSNRLKDKNVGALLQDAQQLARHNPGIFIGSAFALGLLGARFLKSSGDRAGYTGGYRSAVDRRGTSARTHSVSGAVVTPSYDTERL